MWSSVHFLELRLFDIVMLVGSAILAAHYLLRGSSSKAKDPDASAQPPQGTRTTKDKAGEESNEKTKQSKTKIRVTLTHIGKCIQKHPERVSVGKNNTHEYIWCEACWTIHSWSSSGVLI